MGFADMHIHSIYSDGTLAPAEIVTAARARNVELISVCDHNEVRGTLECARIAREIGLTCVTGVEIDAIHEGRDVHILCYGARLDDSALLDRIHRARARLDGMSATLLERMARDGHPLDMAEYDAFPFDHSRGGWKMLQYLQARGLTRALSEGLGFYERYGVRYAEAGFDAAGDVISAVHAAGGRAVLAHPGVTFPSDGLAAFEAQVARALALGFDGVECYYPAHGAGATRRLLEICRRRGLMITAGSDCHGAFNRREIGETRTPAAALDLRGLAL